MKCGRAFSFSSTCASQPPTRDRSILDLVVAGSNSRGVDPCCRAAERSARPSIGCSRRPARGSIDQAKALIADSGTGVRDLVEVILRERCAVSTLELA